MNCYHGDTGISRGFCLKRAAFSTSSSLVYALQLTVSQLRSDNPGSDAFAPPGSLGQVERQDSGPALCRKDDLHVAYWNIRTLLDIGV